MHRLRPGNGTVHDTCTRDFDQIWLDYQHEVGLRHHRAKSNQADGAHGVVPHRLPLVAVLYRPPGHPTRLETAT